MADAWPVTPPQPTDAVVHLVRVDLNPAPEIVDDCRLLLSPEECARADRFVTSQLTRRYTVCRAVLRRLLASVLDVPPQGIRFCSGPHGKPALVENRSELEFNVSHTGDVALMALTRRRTLGVDVETISDRQSQDELAARFFSTTERQAYFSLPEPIRLPAFYRIWTCKEAFLKATGAGLSFPLGRFSVSAVPDLPPGLLYVEGDPDAATRWSFVIPEVGPNLSAALAVDGHGWRLEYRIWQHGPCRRAEENR